MFRREPGPHSPLDAMSCLRLWFGKSNGTDIDIETRFGPHVAIALEGKLDYWQKTPLRCLALMILIDQFPRNIYRHTVRSFARDARLVVSSDARRVCLCALSNSHASGKYR